MPREKKAASVHSGHRQRLKKTALEAGLDSLSDIQCLELLLYYAIPQRNTNELAHLLLDHFGSFAAVLNADYQSLLEVNGIGPNAASLLALMPSFFKKYQQDELLEKRYIVNRSDIIKYAQSLFIGKKHEEFYLICLNSQRRLIKAELLNKGTLTDVHIYPRMAIKKALLHEAKFVILAHNHPGGKQGPSSKDVELTKGIVSLFAAADIIVVDHIIVSDNRYFSFVESGLISRHNNF